VRDQAGRRHPEGWRIGTLLGVPVVLARSWFVIAAVITFLFAPTVQSRAPELGAGAYVVAFLYAILLFASVLVHEVAHAAAAKAFGMPASHIVINLWGGHTQFETEATTAGRSFVVAVVGPASNGLLALAATPLLLSLDGSSIAFLLVFAFVVTNGFVAVFNVVPGLPLDGGRMLEAVIWRLSGDRNLGTIVAGWGGRLVAVLLVVWALVLPLARGRQPDLVTVVWAGLIGALLWSGAGHAVRTARIRRRAPSATVRGLARSAVALPADTSIAEALAAAGVHHPADLGRTAVVLLAPDGRPAAVLDPSAVSGVPEGRRPDVPAHAAARTLPAGAEIDVRLAGEELLKVLATLPGDEWVVRGEDGTVVGLLKGQDVITAMVGNRRASFPSPRS
jgi:Zn-dependent protease